MTQTPNIQRIVALLSAFDDRNHPLTAKDLIARSGVARSTGFALLAALTDRGFLEKTAEGYCLGPRSRQLAFAPTEQIDGQPMFKAATDKRSTAPDGLKLHPQLFERVAATSFRSTPPWKVGFANASLSNPWRVALEQSLIQRCSRLAPSISDIVICHADDYAERQAAQVEEMIGLGIDALVISVSPNPSPTLNACLRECIHSGLPVVAVDRRPESPIAIRHS